MKHAKYLTFFIALFVFSMVYAANIGDNDLNIGKKGSSANKTIKLGSTRTIRSNETAGRLEFSNDGTNYKSFGSGSGGSGGTNLLADSNWDFEAGTTSWTASGGSWTTESAAPLSGTFSGKFNASATSQTLTSQAILIPAGFEGRQCQLHIPYYKYASGTAGDYGVRVLDGDNNVLVDTIQFVVTGATATSQVFQTFPCPALNVSNNTDQLKVVITSTADAGDLILDDVFLGQGRNAVAASQASLFAMIDYGSGTASASWNTIQATGTLTIGKSGSYNDTTKKLTISQPGTYLANGKICLLAVNANTSVGFAFDNDVMGSSVGTMYNLFAATPGDSGCRETSLTFSVANGTTKDVRLGHYVNGTTASIQIGRLTLYRFPSNIAEGSTYEASGWFVDGSVAGADISLGASTVGSPTELTNSSLAITTATGSIPLAIPCSTTNPSTGGTCSVGNESLGVVFDLPQAGNVNICVSFSHYIATAASGNAGATFFLSETANSSQTELQNIGFSSDAVNTPNQSPMFPHTICGIAKFSTAGKKTFRLKYQQNVSSGTISLSTINGGYMRVVAYPVSAGLPTPVFSDYVNTVKARVANSDAGQTVQYAATITNNGSSCLTSNIYGGAWLSSVTRNATGDCTLNYAGGFFNGTDVPVCVSVSSGETTLSAISASTSRWVTRNSSGTAIDGGMYIQCMGRK